MGEKWSSFYNDLDSGGETNTNIRPASYMLSDWWFGINCGTGIRAFSRTENRCNAPNSVQRANLHRKCTEIRCIEIFLNIQRVLPYYYFRSGLFENIFQRIPLKTIWFWQNFQIVPEFDIETMELSLKTMILHIIFSCQKFWIKDFLLNMHRYASIFDQFQSCTDFNFVSLKALL